MIVYKARKFEVHNKSILLPNEKKINIDFVKHNGAAAIIPILNNKIILERQYRYVIGKYLYEIPAGTIEKKESPIECAKRELLEETGYKAKRIIPLFSSFSSPGISTEKIYYFAAYNLKKERTNREENEIITLRFVNILKAVDMIKNKSIIDGKTIQGLLYFYNFINKKSK